MMCITLYMTQQAINIHVHCMFVYYVPVHCTFVTRVPMYTSTHIPLQIQIQMYKYIHVYRKKCVVQYIYLMYIIKEQIKWIFYIWCVFHLQSQSRWSRSSVLTNELTFHMNRLDFLEGKFELFSHSNMAVKKTKFVLNKT